MPPSRPPAALAACLFLLGPLALAHAAAEEEEGEIPPARTHYFGREIAQTMHWQGAGWLLRADREKEENAKRMVEELKLQPGMVVCDLGSGNGYHSLMMAPKVGKDGLVIAVDIQPEMLAMLRERAAAEGLENNIQTVEGEVHDPHLKPGSCDLVLMVDVYHEFSHPEEMLAAIRTALKPDGVAVLVEFRSEDDWVPIKKLHKMSRDQVLKELTANGFKLVRSFDGLPWQHMLFFGRDEGWERGDEGSGETQNPTTPEIPVVAPPEP